MGWSWLANKNYQKNPNRRAKQQKRNRLTKQQQSSKQTSEQAKKAVKQVGKREKPPETAVQPFIYSDQVWKIEWKVYIQFKQIDIT